MVVGERDAVEVAGGGWVATPQQIRSGISSTVKTASALCGRPICAPVIDRVEEVELGVLVGGGGRLRGKGPRPGAWRLPVQRWRRVATPAGDEAGALDVGAEAQPTDGRVLGVP